VRAGGRGQDRCASSAATAEAAETRAAVTAGTELAAGPPGPPGPPGRTVVLAGSGDVDLSESDVDTGDGGRRGAPLYFVTKCPPWVRRCRYRDEERDEKRDSVFPAVIDFDYYDDGEE
jgi:hypothetical protein